MDSDYEAVKRANDSRWTMAMKRDVSKAMADLGEQSNELHDEHLREEDAANADRLASGRRTTAALLDKHRQVVGRRNIDHALSGIPEDTRERYQKMGSVQAVDSSLQEKLMHSKHQLADCRFRVVNKTMYLSQLRTRLIGALTAVAKPPTPVPDDPDIMSPDVVQKMVDALRVGNRRAAQARDMIAEKVRMRRNLQNHLKADLRLQASAIVKMLAYGESAQQEAVTYDKRFCQAVAANDEKVNRLVAIKRRVANKSIALESVRKKVIVNQLQEDNDDIVEDFDFGNPSYDGLSMTSSIMMMEDSSIIEEMILFLDWINTTSVEHKLYPKRKTLNKLNSNSNSNQSSISTIRQYFSASSTSDDFRFPTEKVNKLLLKSDTEEPSKEIEAVEYVCDTLGFSDMKSVLEYFDTVKRVEMRLKKMISLRKHLYELSKENTQLQEEIEMIETNCLPKSIFILDKNIARVKKEGLDVQKKQLKDIKIEIAKYYKSFNELWFQLDILAGKLIRCQVPVVRKWQKKKRNTEGLEDAQLLLENLHLRLNDDEDRPDGNHTSCSGEKKSIKYERRDNDTSNFNGNTVVDSCRELITTLHTKVKACMYHIGSDFEPTDRKQLAARAYYGFNQQYQYYKASLEKKDERKPLVRRQALNMAPSIHVDTESRADADKFSGILTREQAKQKAIEFVQWHLSPKDTDDAMSTRKPISFRKPIKTAK